MPIRWSGRPVSDAIERFMAASAELGLTPEVRRFPEGTKTAVDAAEAIGCDVGQIVKSLVFMADDRRCWPSRRAPTVWTRRKLAAVAGATTVRRATPEEARAATGFAVGGTPPFGHPARVTSFLTRICWRYEEVWAAAGTPDSVFPLTPDELLRVSGARNRRCHGRCLVR